MSSNEFHDLYPYLEDLDVGKKEKGNCVMEDGHKEEDI